MTGLTKAEITADTIAKLKQAGITVEQQASDDGEEQQESAEEEKTQATQRRE